MPYAPLVLDPVGTVPAITTTDLPDFDAVPMCVGHEHVNGGLNGGQCNDPARWRMQLAHLRRMPTCAPAPVLVCDRHRRAIEERARNEMRQANGYPCVRCRQPGRDFTSIVRSVVAL